jgi:hypothetical protein
MQIPCQPSFAARRRRAVHNRRPARLGWALLLAGALLSGCYVSIGDGVDLGFIDITTQPQDVTATVGSIARFSVSVAGSGNLRFQWRRNGGDLANTDRPTYETAPVVLADDGAVFSVRVCNAFTCTSSSGATLVVVQ